MNTAARQSSTTLLALAALLGTACLGQIGSGGGAPEPAARGSGDGRAGASPAGGPRAPGGAGGPGAPGAAGRACAPAGAPPALRRLTNAEYENTVQDLLAAAPGVTRAFLPDDGGLGFRNAFGALAVTSALAEQYSDTAAALAADAMKRVTTLAPCAAGAAGAAEAACAESFIRGFGKRAYRRPLTAGEVSAYASLFQGERARSSYAGGIATILETMLQSPYFLYRTELGDGTAADRRLTPYEVASEISYLVIGSMPDAALFAAADDGKLATPDDIELQVRRLMATPRAKPWLRDFVVQWMGIGNAGSVVKDPKVYPTYDQTLRAAVVQESQTFIDAVLGSAGNGSVQTLLTASWSFANAALARHYGVAPPSGQGMQRIDLPPSQRAGILTQAAFLASHSKPNESFPIARGKYLWERVLCQPLSPPPADLKVTAPPPSTATTTRERFAQHSSVPPCSGCHRLIDPLGFGLESYDGIGAYRTTENGKPVDASGEIVGLSGDLAGPFRGGVELAAKLGASAVVRECTARNAFRWALGRDETDAEQCLFPGIAARAGNGADLRELLVAVARTDAFVLRSDR